MLKSTEFWQEGKLGGEEGGKGMSKSLPKTRMTKLKEENSLYHVKYTSRLNRVRKANVDISH